METVVFNLPPTVPWGAEIETAKIEGGCLVVSFQQPKLSLLARSLAKKLKLDPYFIQKIVSAWYEDKESNLIGLLTARLNYSIEPTKLVKALQECFRELYEETLGK